MEQPTPLRRKLALFGGTIVLLATAGLAIDARTEAQSGIPPVSTFAGIAGASDAMRDLGLDDDRALAAMLSATFDGTRELPFDASRYRTDAAGRLRLVRSILPIVRRIVESPVFHSAYATMRAERIAYEPPRARTRHVEQEGAEERRRADAERRRLEREAAIPADPNTFVATRLRDFLALTEAIPWRARLATNERGHRVFVDATLEQKPRDWKLCFRAGRPALDAARTFARRWLADLDRAAPPTQPPTR